MTEETKNNNVAESVAADVAAEVERSMGIEAQIKKHTKIFWTALIGLVLSTVMLVWLRSELGRRDVTPNTPQIESVGSLNITEGPDTDPEENMLKGIVMAVATLFTVSMVVGCYESDKIQNLEKQKQTC